MDELNVVVPGNLEQINHARDPETVTITATDPDTEISGKTSAIAFRQPDSGQKR